MAAQAPCRESLQLPNSQHAFVECVHIDWRGPPPADVRVRVNRAIEPRLWQDIPFRLERQGGRITARFLRPDNWAHLQVEIAAPGPGTLSAELQCLPREAPEVLLDRLARQRCIFLGAARDCAQALPATLDKLDEMRSLFGQTEVHVFENDSTDGSDTWLADAQGAGRLTLHQMQGLDASLPRRTERLAMVRNHLLEVALSRGPWDYVCWLDMDGLVGPKLELPRFVSCFRHPEVWDAVFPLSWPVYYDLWAFRDDYVCDNDFLYRSKYVMSAVMVAAQETHAGFRQLSPGHMLGWLPVQSAFGGLAIYKGDIVGRGRYVGLARDAAGEHEVCEHVAYNRSLVQAGARMYLNPDCHTHMV